MAWAITKLKILKEIADFKTLHEIPIEKRIDFKTGLIVYISVNLTAVFGRRWLKISRYILDQTIFSFNLTILWTKQVSAGATFLLLVLDFGTLFQQSLFLPSDLDKNSSLSGLISSVSVSSRSTH